MLVDLRAASLVLVAASALTVIALVRLRDAGGIAPGAPDVRAPTTVAPLIRTLDRRGITRASANYWVAFRVTFLTEERIVVAPNGGDRYPPYSQLVARSSRVAQIFVAGSATEGPQRPALLSRGYKRLQAGPYIVYLPP